MSDNRFPAAIDMQGFVDSWLEKAMVYWDTAAGCLGLVSSARACRSTSDALRTWIADRPEIAEQLLRVLARRLRRTNNTLADLIFTDVPGRVAKLLLQLAQRFGIQDDGALRVTHELTQEEIAQLVGASRETVNKALAEFAHRGWIRVDVKTVWICDSDRLARRAK